MFIPTESSNPLRPYYIPPSPNPSLVLGDISSPVSYSGKNASSTASTSRSLGASARDILADMDYSEYLSDSSQSSGEIISSLMQHAIWNYTCIFLAQPFDVAKTVLQVQSGYNGQERIRNASDEDAKKASKNHQRDLYEVC